MLAANARSLLRGVCLRRLRVYYLNVVSRCIVGRVNSTPSTRRQEPVPTVRHRPCLTEETQPRCFFLNGEPRCCSTEAVGHE